jgi:hydroxymethylglutaryl-CoA lyase
MVRTLFPQRVVIREVGPREGFQAFPKVVATDRKVDLIHALVQAGLRDVEVTSFVRPDKVPQLADAEELVVRLPSNSQVRFTALYLNKRGFERAEAAATLSNQGWLYTSPSQSFLRANSNTTIEESLRDVTSWCSLFRAHKKRVYGLMVSTAFGCAYEGAISPHVVVDLISQYLDALRREGELPAEICLADTVGMADPLSLERCISAVRGLGIPVSLHLHDTRGLGLTNSYVALQLGVTTFETSIGGIGGCPFTPGAAGNVATEDLVYLCRSLGIETGLDLEGLCAAAKLAELIMGVPLPGRVYKAMGR